MTEGSESVVRGRIAKLLTDEVRDYRAAQDTATTERDKLYRMGQKDALILVAPLIDQILAAAPSTSVREEVECEACLATIPADEAHTVEGFTACRPCFPVSDKPEDSDRFLRGRCYRQLVVPARTSVREEVVGEALAIVKKRLRVIRRDREHEIADCAWNEAVLTIAGDLAALKPSTHRGGGE